MTDHILPAGAEHAASALKLDDLMSDNILGDLLQSVSSISGLRISLRICQGDDTLSVNEFVTCPFYKEAIGDEQLHSICMRCSGQAGAIAARREAPFIYRCYAGLACAAIPVLIDDSHVATIIVSGFRLQEEAMEDLPQLCAEESHRVPGDRVSTAPMFHYKRIMDISSLLLAAARHIAQANLRNQMQEELHRHKMELMAQQQARLNAERLLSQAEFKALQSQINPHFLFNTLNAISQLATLEGSGQTADAIFSLSALLRRCLKKNDFLPPLRDEIDDIAEYINIKKLLYRDRIRFVRRIDPDCLSLRVPLFTVQPLVENALIHGLEPKEAGGTLTLSVERQDDWVVLTVADDGMGCPPDTLDQLRQVPPEETRTDLTGIGMGIVIKRLESHFGSDFRWTMESEIDRGTRVTLYLPDGKER